MPRLSFLVPVEFVQTENDIMLVLKNSDEQEAAFLFSQCTDPVALGVMHQWAEEKVSECLKSRRKPTGAVDSNGTMIFEGDIVECTYKDDNGEVPTTAAVKFHAPYGAFIIEGRFVGPGNGGWATTNMQGSQLMTVLGNVFENPGLLSGTPRPVKCQDETDQDYVTRGGREPALKSYD